ncbi:MAG: pilus assembly protein TadG-related protein [Deltaproteobacteria bacterium]|nr:pilus assembly protein TadG-related protein [Deltaproteobacteria bacterium]
MIRRFHRRERGMVLPTTGLFILMSIGMLAVGIDLGNMYLVKCELQRIADASALAGALRLVSPASGMSQVAPLSPDCGRASTAAQAVATSGSNSAAAEPLPPANLDIKFGIYDLQSKTFTDTSCAVPSAVNAVRAVASKMISFYLGSIVSGRSQVNLSAQALALTGVVGGGRPSLPLAVDADKLPSNGEKLVIHLNPTPADDGCWHTFNNDRSSSSLLNDYLEGREPIPNINVGDLINAKQGVDANTLKCLERQLDEHGGTWVAMVPVIPPDNHSGWVEVLGFAAIRLTLVESHGDDKRIEAETLENYVAPGASPGGSGNYGLYAGAPKLVQ